jgi:hypothetical protein
VLRGFAAATPKPAATYYTVTAYATPDGGSSVFPEPPQQRAADGRPDARPPTSSHRRRRRGGCRGRSATQVRDRGEAYLASPGGWEGVYANVPPWGLAGGVAAVGMQATRGSARERLRERRKRTTQAAAEKPPPP